MVTLIIIGILFIAFIGAPLFTVFGAASLALFLNLPEGSWASVGVDVFSAKFAESTTLMTIPLFTFAGYLLAESGAPLRLVRFANAWLGWAPGGLPLVCLFTCAFFTTFTGGSGITIVAIGGLIFPALLHEKYDEKFSLGLVTTGGSLGILFPPSVPLIMYGIVASLAGFSMSLAKLMVAGVLPGMIVLAILGVYGMYVGIRNKVPRAKFDRKEAFHTAWVFKWELLIPIVLVTGLGTGMFRVHEASAFTAIYVLIVELFVYRDVSITKDLPRITIKSMIMVGAILTIVATAVGFTGWNVQAQIPDRLADWMESMISSKFVFLFLLNIFLLIVGALMDIFTAMMVVIPMLMPLAKLYHVDPYHLAIIFILNLEIGYLTPPFGLNLFISTIRFSRPFMFVVRTVLPYIAILAVALGVVTYVPWFSTVGANLITADESASPLSSVIEGMDDTGAADVPSVMDEAEYDKMFEKNKAKPPAPGEAAPAAPAAGDKPAEAAPAAPAAGDKPAAPADTAKQPAAAPPAAPAK